MLVPLGLARPRASLPAHGARPGVTPPVSRGRGHGAAHFLLVEAAGERSADGGSREGHGHKAGACLDGPCPLSAAPHWPRRLAGARASGQSTRKSLPGPAGREQSVLLERPGPVTGRRSPPHVRRPGKSDCGEGPGEGRRAAATLATVHAVVGAWPLPPADRSHPRRSDVRARVWEAQHPWTVERCLNPGMPRAWVPPRGRRALITLYPEHGRLPGGREQSPGRELGFRFFT